MLDGPGGTGCNVLVRTSIENDTHGIEKLLLKTQVSSNKFLHSEVNLLIQHIIVQDQHGQKNNTNNIISQLSFFYHVI